MIHVRAQRRPMNLPTSSHPASDPRSGRGCAEIARIGESVGADGTEIGKLERRAENSRRCSLVPILRTGPTRKPQAARNEHDFLRLPPATVRVPYRGSMCLLGDDEHLAIGAIKETPLHGTVGRHTSGWRIPCWLSGDPFPATGTSPSTKSAGPSRGQGIPTQLVRRHGIRVRGLVNRACASARKG